MLPVAVVLMDVASQSTKTEMFSAWIRYLSMMVKLALFGDHQQ